MMKGWATRVRTSVRGGGNCSTTSSLSIEWMTCDLCLRSPSTGDFFDPWRHGIRWKFILKKIKLNEVDQEIGQGLHLSFQLICISADAFFFLQMEKFKKTPVSSIVSWRRLDEQVQHTPISVDSRSSDRLKTSSTFLGWWWIPRFSIRCALNGRFD